MSLHKRKNIFLTKLFSEGEDKAMDANTSQVTIQ